MPAARAVLVLAVLASAPLVPAEPVAVWATNPRYFARDGKPLVLVTSDHHYGAVIDAEFDYVRSSTRSPRRA